MWMHELRDQPQRLLRPGGRPSSGIHLLVRTSVHLREELLRLALLVSIRRAALTQGCCL